MDTGTKISASAHAVLLGWLLVGNIFRAEPLPMNVQEVSVITSGQFEAMLAAQTQPEAATEAALPQVEDTPPETDFEPRTIEAPDPLELPEDTVLPQPDPQPELPQVDEAPTLVPPQEDLAVLTPNVDEDSVPQQADRVAPEPVAQPDPEVTPDPVEQDAVTEDGTGDQVQEEQDATAPEETTTELLTEADEPARAPERSIRPPSRRPEPQTAAVEPEPEPEPEEDNAADAIAAAVAAAQETPTPRPAPTGPPLTGGEREGLKVAVSNCWNVGALSTEAQETRVTVYVAMNRDGTPQIETIRMVGFEGGSEGSAGRVYRTARSAIVRCGRDGFPLPPEKFGQWQEIEMTFNPEGMFWR